MSANATLPFRGKGKGKGREKGEQGLASQVPVPCSPVLDVDRWEEPEGMDAGPLLKSCPAPPHRRVGASGVVYWIGDGMGQRLDRSSVIILLLPCHQAPYCSTAPCLTNGQPCSGQYQLHAVLPHPHWPGPCHHPYQRLS